MQASPEEEHGIQLQRAWAALTASPRSPEPSFMLPIFVQPICRVGRQQLRTPCSFGRRMQHTFTPSSTFRV